MSSEKMPVTTKVLSFGNILKSYFHLQSMSDNASDSNTKQNLPWPPWVVWHKIEKILFVLHHPGGQGKYCFLSLSLTVLLTNFTNVNDPLCRQPGNSCLGSLGGTKINRIPTTECRNATEPRQVQPRQLGLYSQHFNFFLTNKWAQ
jgi:hypothetical protein